MSTDITKIPLLRTAEETRKIQESSLSPDEETVLAQIARRIDGAARNGESEITIDISKDHYGDGFSTKRIIALLENKLRYTVLRRESCTHEIRFCVKW